MMQVVQSTCPGCKKALRMPAAWAVQAVRCKHCGMILQMKNPRLAAAFTTPRKAPVAARPAVPLSQTPPPTTRAPAVALPVAIPVGVPTGSRDPFATLANGGTVPPRRRGGGGWWKGIALLICVAGVAGALAVFAGPHLAELLQAPPTSTQVAESGAPDDGEGSVEPPKTEMPKTDLPRKDTQPEVPPRDTRPEPPKDTKPEPKDTTPEPPKATQPEPPPRSTRPTRPSIDLPRTAGPFPRRALVISANNYLYFSPVYFGMPLPQSRNPHTLLSQLNRGLRFPLNQTLLISDAAPRNATPPIKGVIQETIKDFLTSSRAQDRIVLAFIGHYVEMEEEVFLVPVEGDREDKETLVPLSDLYKQLEACPARQKVLILDVCRFNPGRGLERPGSGLAEVPEDKLEGSMGPRLDAMLQAPPPGVQVWSSCSPWERSLEYDNAYLQNGVFLEALQEVVAQGIEGSVQKPEDPIPVAALVDRVNVRMKQLLDPLGKKQVSRLTGQEAQVALPYDPDAVLAPEPKVKLPAGVGEFASEKQVEEILAAVTVPPIKAVRTDSELRAKALPMFQAKTLAMYAMDSKDTEFRKAVKAAQKALQDTLGVKGLREEFSKPAPNAADRFKADLAELQKRIAIDQGDLQEVLDELLAVDTPEAREMETSKGWLATADYIKARLQSQIAYLYEYQSALGAMRKDFPPLDEAVHNGWRLSAIPNLQGDGQGKKLAKDSDKIFVRIIKEHPGTPWEVLARRDRLTALGLDWQATKIGGQP